VTLLYFAWLRQKLGTGHEQIDIPAHVRTVHQLVEYLSRRGDTFSQVFSDLRGIRPAVNQDWAEWTSPIQPDDEVAFFPPVTGG
jgi:molybdopterin synthase sulfur carrier subunit